MVTFNVDSLDFQDEERARFGNSGEFDLGYNDATDALAIEDRVNSALAEIPRGTETDLIGGKFAQTLDEGKVLNDAGNVYESIQAAVDDADSWVKIGPGTFNESVTIDTAGLTLEGIGDRTFIDGSGISNSIIDVVSTNVCIANLRLNGYQNGTTSLKSVKCDSDGLFIENVTSTGSDSYGFDINSSNCTISRCEIANASEAISLYGADQNNIIVNNLLLDSSGSGIDAGGSGGDSADDTLIANNIVKRCDIGFNIRGNDTIVYGNLINNTSSFGISVAVNNSLVAKNRLIGTNGINDNGTNTTLDSNLVTE